MRKDEKANEFVKSATKNVRRDLPGKMGIVRCNSFRCLGMMGEDGVWRDAHHRPLQVVEIVTEF